MTKWIAVLCLTLSACGTPYYVKIDAYGSDAGAPRTFHIFEPDFLPRSDLSNAEQYTNIESALIKSGYTKAPPQEARQLIVATWGTEPPETIARMSLAPTIGLVPTGSTFTGVASTQGAFTNMTGTQTNQHQLGVTGLQPVQTFANVTPLNIVITSLDIARLPANTPPMLWQISISAQLFDDNLPRMAMSQMLNVAAPYFGKSGGAVKTLQPALNNAPARASRIGSR